jgi:hypothetical protein
MRRQIDVITTRCYATLCQLRAVRRYVSQPVMQSLVTSLVLSRLDHFNCVLLGLPASSIRWLQTIQNAAARLVSAFVAPTTSPIRLFVYTGYVLLTVMTFRSIHGLPPSYLRGFVPYQARRPGLRSTSSRRLIVPRTRLSSVGDRSFPVTGAKVWNELPSNVTPAPSLSIFRNQLKTYLSNFSYPGLVIEMFLSHCSYLRWIGYVCFDGHPILFVFCGLYMS